MHSDGNKARLANMPSLGQSLVAAYLHLRPHAPVETARKGQVIVREDDFADHAMLLLDGWVAFSKMLPDGETQIVDVMLDGDFALIGAETAPIAAFSVEALSDARFINIRAPNANGPAPEQAGLRILMAAGIVRTQARISELLLRLGQGSAASRVAYGLLEFYIRLDAIGRVKGHRFGFPITQQKFGAFTGLSNVHVCRTMRRFERDGFIAHPGPGEIALNDITALCDIAGVDLDVLRHEILIQRDQ